MSAFVLHPRLAADCLPVGDLELCQVLLMNDSRYPWLILVPRVADIREVFELTSAAQAQLWREVTATGQNLLAASGSTKLNIGALGNLVPQLHVHVIGRRADDAAWPAPVWGLGVATGYPEPRSEAQAWAAKLGIKPA